MRSFYTTIQENYKIATDHMAAAYGHGFIGLAKQNNPEEILRLLDEQIALEKLTLNADEKAILTEAIKEAQTKFSSPTWNLIIYKIKMVPVRVSS